MQYEPDIQSVDSLLAGLPLQPGISTAWVTMDGTVTAEEPAEEDILLECFLYRDDAGALISYVTFIVNTSPEKLLFAGHLDVATHREHRRQGYASALLALLMERRKIQVDMQRYSTAGKAWTDKYVRDHKDDEVAPDLYALYTCEELGMHTTAGTCTCGGE